jgi:hypothetical protein
MLVVGDCCAGFEWKACSKVAIESAALQREQREAAISAPNKELIRRLGVTMLRRILIDVCRR